MVHRQRFFNLVVTNVPGPGVPLYVLGARMLEAFPIVPIAGNLSVGVAALSYGEQLTIGLLADPGACPDLDVFADGINHSFAELVTAAGEHRDRISSTAMKEPTRESMEVQCHERTRVSQALAAPRSSSYPTRWRSST